MRFFLRESVEISSHAGDLNARSISACAFAEHNVHASARRESVLFIGTPSVTLDSEFVFRLNFGNVWSMDISHPMNASVWHTVRQGKMGTV